MAGKADSLRGPRFPELPDIADDDLVRVIREFRPELARKFGFMRPWSQRADGIRFPRGGALEILSGRHNAGQYSVPLFWPDDEFYPVLEFAAHLLARRINANLQGKRWSDIAMRLGVSMRAVDRAAVEPRDAVTSLIQDLRGIAVRQRTLEKQRRAWRETLPGRAVRRYQLEVLESSVRSFLQQPRLRLVKRTRRRA